MSSGARDLSEAMAAAVERAGRAVVRVEARRRGPSSGIVWSADGVILAAHHNVEWDDDIAIGLPEGTTTAKIVGRDPTTDLVVLRGTLEGAAEPEWRDEAPRVGSLVLALTRPGRGVRASLGVVHARGDEWRTPEGGRVDGYLQTDIGLSPGFSGGLLVDIEGRALGVTNAGLLRGMSLAVPPATLRRVVASLLEHGRVRRGFIGVGTVPVRLPAALEKATGQPSGLLVTSVEEDSGAGRAGILLGDALLAADGRPLSGPADLMPLIEEDGIGRTVGLRLVRGGDIRDVALTVGARPARGARG